MVEAGSTRGQPKWDSMRSHAIHAIPIKMQYCNCMSRKGLSKKICCSKKQNRKEKLQKKKKNNSMCLLRSSLAEAQQKAEQQRVSEGSCPRRLTAGRQEGNGGAEALRWEVTSSHASLPLLAKICGHAQ